MNVTYGWHTGTAFTNYSFLHEMSETKILIDVTVASTMLMLRVAPLMTFSPFVVRGGTQ